MKYSVLILAVLLSACASTAQPTIWQAGVADIVSTELAITVGGQELNPAGYPGVILVKLAATVYVENIADCEQRLFYDRTITSLSMGAAANNLLVYLGSWTPLVGISALAAVAKQTWDYRLSKDQNACESTLGPAAEN